MDISPHRNHLGVNYSNLNSINPIVFLRHPHLRKLRQSNSVIIQKKEIPE